MNSRLLVHCTGFLKATHLLPTLVVTVLVTLFAWRLGWRDVALLGIFFAILTGQASVGWSNDAFDSQIDKRVGRQDKPTVRLRIRPRNLWIAAAVALAISSTLSWIVAGLIGGSWHVFALAMAWAYNLRLSRTWWSWLPYALAFGSLPAFLTFGLDGEAPPWWMVVSFAVIGTSAHLANALPDLEMDKEAGLSGFVVQLGRVNAVRVCWSLLVIGSVVLVVGNPEAGIWLPILLGFTLIAGGGYARLSRHRRAIFHVIILSVIVEVVILLALTSSIHT